MSDLAFGEILAFIAFELPVFLVRPLEAAANVSSLQGRQLNKNMHEECVLETPTPPTPAQETPPEPIIPFGFHWINVQLSRLLQSTIS